MNRRQGLAFISAAIVLVGLSYGLSRNRVSRVEIWNPYTAGVSIELVSFDRNGRVAGTSVHSPGQPGSFVMTRSSGRRHLRVSVAERPDLAPAELDVRPGDRVCVQVRVEGSRLTLEPRDPADRMIMPEAIPDAPKE